MCSNNLKYKAMYIFCKNLVFYLIQLLSAINLIFPFKKTGNKLQIVMYITGNFGRITSILMNLKINI